jgi:hypothetical protein
MPPRFLTRCSNAERRANCHLNEALLMSTLRDGDRLVRFPRWAVDERLPVPLKAGSLLMAIAATSVFSDALHRRLLRFAVTCGNAPHPARRADAASRRPVALAKARQ